MATAKGTELTTADTSNYAVLRTDQRVVADVLRENLGGGSIRVWDFNIIKVPAGGVTQWERLNPLTGEVTYSPTFEGVIVHTKSIRSFWRDKFSGAGSPPDCSSPDALIGIGDPGGACIKCPMAQFDSAARLWDDVKGSAQACKENRLLFVLGERGLLPSVVKGPPSSLSAIKKYMLALAGEGIGASSVTTVFRLQKAKSETGIEYAQIVPAMGAPLDPDSASKIALYAAQLRVAIDGFENMWTLTDDAVEEMRVETPEAV